METQPVFAWEGLYANFDVSSHRGQILVGIICGWLTCSSVKIVARCRNVFARCLLSGQERLLSGISRTPFWDIVDSIWDIVDSIWDIVDSFQGYRGLLSGITTTPSWNISDSFLAHQCTVVETYTTRKAAVNYRKRGGRGDGRTCTRRVLRAVQLSPLLLPQLLLEGIGASVGLVTNKGNSSAPAHWNSGKS